MASGLYPRCGVVVAVMFVCGLIAPGVALSRGHPGLASYSADQDRLFWFLHVTDIHVGYGSEATENLELLVNEGQAVFQPWFYLVTGDLVEDGRLEEWLQYREIITAAGLGPDLWLDIPGNHDNNLDGDDFEPGFLDYYLEHSICGAVNGQVHHNFVLDTDFGRYQVVGVYTDGDADRLIPPDELDFVRSTIESEPDARLVFVGGHHPLEGTESAEENDARALQELMGEYGVSLYCFGHVHWISELLWPHRFNEHGYLPWLSRTAGKPQPVVKPAGFSVLAVDNDSLIGREVTFRKEPFAPTALPLPLVLITSPADASFGGENPYAYPVSASSPDNPVRALVFADGPPDQVRLRLNDNAWKPMHQVEGPLWAGQFDGADLSVDPWLEVEASAQGETDAHRIVLWSIPEAACQDGLDNDGDGAVDFPDDPGCTGGFDTDENEPFGVPPYDPGEEPADEDAGTHEPEPDAWEDGGTPADPEDAGTHEPEPDAWEDGGTPADPSDTDIPRPDSTDSGGDPTPVPDDETHADGCACGLGGTQGAGWLVLVLLAGCRRRRRHG